MDEVFFEGIRCFHDPYSCPLKPITLLVGENSSGKTTFLALSRIAWDIVRGNLSEDIFNEEPFLLGSYDQIASFRGGKAGRVKSFTVGLQTSISKKFKSNGLFSSKVKILAKFVADGSESQIEEWQFICGNFKLISKPVPRSDQLEIIAETPDGSYKFVKIPFFRGTANVLDVLSNLRFFLSRDLFSNKDNDENQPSFLSDDVLRDLQDISFVISRSLGERPYAFAPIRTKPQRTYDPLKDVPKPEGTHVPMLLARMLSEKSKSGENLREALTSFGKASGLFNDLEVKRKGYKESDPFQITVKTVGPTSNLVDVGYGVSQVLPIIVDVVLNPNNSTFLLQQPEVHLHPKAQAELGSFLMALAKEQGKKFIIETHSDYLIDRIRMDIREKKYLSTDDVMILYFEKTAAGVNIFKLNIDEFGNISNAPSTYRQFFLNEERRMLGV